MLTTAGNLHELLKKYVPHHFLLSENQLASIRTLIDAVLTPEVLSLPVPGLTFSVDTAASDYGLECALFQSYANGERWLTGFCSRSHNDAKRNYLPTEREFLAIVWALKTLRAYLLFESFVVRFDQSSLKW